MATLPKEKWTHSSRPLNIFCNGHNMNKNYLDDPLSFVSMLLRPIRPSRWDLATQRARQKEAERKLLPEQRDKTKERMRKHRKK